jgi:hypothetical protein
MATTDHAETPTPAASRSLDGRQKTFTSGVGEAPPMTPPPAAGYNAPPAAPIENAKTHTYGITTDTGYGVGWDLRLPDGSIGMASAKHVTAGDTKYPPVISTPDSDFAVSRTTDGVKGGLDLASRDAEPGDQVALVTPQQGPLPATVTGSEVVTPDGGGGETFHTTTVDRPVIPGDSGSPGVLIKPGDPDHGKVVGTVSCTDQSETAMVPASTMREAVGAHHDLFTAPGQGYGRNAALDSPVGTPTEPDISATAGRLGISR